MSPHQDVPSSPDYASYAVQRPAYYDQFETSSVDSRDIGLHQRPLLPGIHVPTVVFFDDNEDLDEATIAMHAIRLAKAGVAGLTVQGSNGEAVHLTHHERNRVTLVTRKALDSAGFTDMPVIVGCASESIRGTVSLTIDAKENGGDYALVLPPSYYKGLFNKDTVRDFFLKVADNSPIPILIYNYPGAVSGMDMNSDDIIELAKHPNIVGCKLTCGNTGKLARVAAATRAATPQEPGSGFMCMGGSADFTLQTLVVGGSGIIGGFANIAPKACVALIKLVDEGKYQEARKLQAIVARGDWAAIQGGLVGTKAALVQHYGYGGHARSPLPRPNKEENRRWKDAFDEVVKVERAL